MRSLSVDDAGPAYLASILGDEAGLCAKLAMCPLDEGRYTTYVPVTKKTCDVGRIHKAGFLSARESHEVLSSFPAYLRDDDTKLRNGTLIVQSPWSQPADAAPRSLDDDILLKAGFGVCHTCRIEDLNSKEFDFMIGDTIAMRYIACFINDEMTVSEACLASESKFCAAVAAIMVPAYDGESILM